MAGRAADSAPPGVFARHAPGRVNSSGDLILGNRAWDKLAFGQTLLELVVWNVWNRLG
jgi:hypothetical protein